MRLRSRICLPIGRSSASRQNDGQLAEHATRVRNLATLRLGEVMEEMRQAGRLASGKEGKRKGLGIPKNPSDRRTLEDYGVDKNLAQRARRAAAMSEEKFEAAVEKAARLAAQAHQKATGPPRPR
jgi:hypothetical protein